MLHYLLLTGTTSDIGAVLPTLVSLQKNFSYCISNNTVNFCSNCKNGDYSKNKVDKGLPLNTSLKVPSGADETSSLSYSSIKSVSTIIPIRNNNKDGSSYVLSIDNRKKTTGLTYSSIKSVFTNRPKQDNHMDKSPEPDVPNPATNLPVSTIPSVSKLIQDKQTNESTSRSVESDEYMKQTINPIGPFKMSLPKVIPSQNEYTDERLKTITSIEKLNAMVQPAIENSNSEASSCVSNSSIQKNTKSFRAERLPHMRNILLYYDCRTKIKYEFIYSHSRGSHGQYYKCNRKSADGRCGKGNYVRNGYFTRNPAVGHTCLPADRNHIGLSCSREEPIESPTRFLAERVPGFSRYILSHRHLETGLEYRFCYISTFRSGVQFYRCTRSQFESKLHCSKCIHVENGYFLANPAVGHTCLAMKSTTESPRRILAERVPGASNFLLYHHLETGQEYRFSYSNTLRSGVQTYRCTRNKIGTKNKCSRSIHVENGYFLANPAAGHNCK